MRIIYFLTIAVASLFLIPMNLSADQVRDADSLWNQGVELYNAGKWSEAADAFLEIESMGVESAGLCYNIGNCYFRQDDALGKAILYYERSLKLDPSFDDARFNLSMAQAATLDNIESIPPFVLVTWLRGLMDCLDSNSWAVISLILFVVTAVLLLLFRFGFSLTLRKVSFFTMLITLIFALSSLGFSVASGRDAQSHDEAVVTARDCSVKSAPSQMEKTLFILHEGTKVSVLDNVGQWERVKLGDGREGWVMTDYIETI